MMNRIIAFASLFSAMAAMATAIFGMLTVQEIKKQRLSSQQPEIVISPFSFYVYRRSGFIIWSMDDLDYSKKIKASEADRKIINFKLINAGYGVAKNIIATTSFARHVPHLRNIKSRSAKSKGHISVEKYDLNIPFLLAAARGGDGGYSLSLPKHLLEYFSLGLSPNNSKSTIVDKFAVEVSFEDINANIYKRGVTITLKSELVGKSDDYSKYHVVAKVKHAAVPINLLAQQINPPDPKTASGF